MSETCDAELAYASVALGPDEWPPGTFPPGHPDTQLRAFSFWRCTRPHGHVLRLPRGQHMDHACEGNLWNSYCPGRTLREGKVVLCWYSPGHRDDHMDVRSVRFPRVEGDDQGAWCESQLVLNNRWMHRCILGARHEAPHQDEAGFTWPWAKDAPPPSSDPPPWHEGL